MPEENTFKITMLGASGVGKTTILTVMCKAMDKVVARDDNRLRLQPGKPNDDGLAEQVALGKFEEYHQELSRLKDEKGPVSPDKEGIKGTSQNAEYHFYLDILRGSKRSSKLQMEFRDFPGGWIQSDNSERNTVKEYLKDSPVTIIAIDTPALIEKNGQYHHDMNMSEGITYLLRQACELDAYLPQQKRLKRLVILAPVKCEYYMKNNRTEEINVKIKEHYETLFADLRQRIPNVALVIIPIQTLGGLSFFEIVKNPEGKPKFLYCHNNAEWKTVNAEQPLRFILAFMLKNYLQDLIIGRGILFQWLHNLLGSDKDLIEAITRFAESSVRLAGANGNGIEIIQGEDLLTLD